MSTKNVTNFVKLIIALITGDDAQATAIKIQKKAAAALTAQIAVKNAFTLSLEENVEQAEERLQLARINNGELITNTDVYIKNLLAYRRALLVEEKVLGEHLDVIAFLKATLSDVNS